MDTQEKPSAQVKQKPIRGPKIQRLPIQGVLLLDKPLGLTSNDALGKAKWLLKALKAGHTGTLDPLATGLLPLCFGEATKFSQDLLEADKEYLAEIHLGTTTASGDAEGEVIRTEEVCCTHHEVKQCVDKFLGEISQVPPMYSALKKDGRPLYAYARAGETVERQARRVTIHELEVLSIELPKVKVRVLCSKGTYIRTLAEDIGNALGCGAHLTALRRSKVGDLLLTDAVTLEQIEQANENDRLSLLAPVDALLKNLPRIDFDAEMTRRFMHGQRVAFLVSKELSQLPEPYLVKIYDDKAQFLGVAQYKAGVLHPERLMRYNAN